jgi:hypothetical protein
MGLAVGAALADGKCTRRPGLGDKARPHQSHGQGKHDKRAALRGSGRNDQEKLPKQPAGI